MHNNIMFDISPDKSSSSEDEDVIKLDQQNSSIMSVRAPNLFDSDTSQQQFQQIADQVPSIRKQQMVSFDTLQTSDGEKRQLTKWEVQEKENRSSNYFTIENHKRRGNSQTKQTTESQEYLLRQKCYQQNQKTQKQQPRKSANYTSIDNFKSQQMTKELLELDLPALISQITHKRRAVASFHTSQMYNSITKPQNQQKQGCIVKQQIGLGKQNSQCDMLEAQRERSITLIVRQPGKIVNQKQLKSNSIATRK